jgi:drug/metabolite transporter (DMT)-like permease
MLEGKTGLTGDLLIMGAVLTASFYIVAARDLGRDNSAWAITCYQVLYGAMFFAPFFLFEAVRFSFAAISMESLGAAVYLTLCATVLAYLCYNYGLTKIAASRAAVFINGIPVVTTGAAWLILGERLNGIQAMGGGMVLAGVWLTNTLGRKGRPGSQKTHS